MQSSDAFDGALPPPRDDEPASLRQDIVDELGDHLESAFRRQLLSTPDPEQARRDVLDRFGNPQRIARQLWFDALKEKMMSQRLMIAMIVLMTLICAGALGFTYMVIEEGRLTTRIMFSQIECLIDKNRAVNIENAHANEALLAQIAKLTAATAAPPSLDWTNVKVALTQDDPQKGALPDGFTASIWGKILSATEADSVRNKVGPDGVVDFGLIRTGQAQLYVEAPWGEFCEQHFLVRPGAPIVVDVVCPTAAPAIVDIAFSVDWPTNLRNKNLWLVCAVAPRTRRVRGLSWQGGGTDRIVAVTESGSVIDLVGPSVDGTPAAQVRELFYPTIPAQRDSAAGDVGWHWPGSHFVIPNRPAKPHMALPALDYVVSQLLVVIDPQEFAADAMPRAKVIGGLIDAELTNGFPMREIADISPFGGENCPPRSWFAVLTQENRPTFHAAEGQENHWKINLPDDLFEIVRANVATKEIDTDETNETDGSSAAAIAN